MSCCGNGKLITFELVDHRLITLDLDCDEDWGDIEVFVDSDTNEPVIQIGTDADGYVNVLRCFVENTSKIDEEYISMKWQNFALIDNIKVIEMVLVRMLAFCDGFTKGDLKASLDRFGIDIEKVTIPSFEIED